MSDDRLALQDAVVQHALLFRVLAVYQRWEERGAPDPADWGWARDLLTQSADAALFEQDPPARDRFFASLASAVAVLSLAPGGVRAFGQHWCWACHDRCTGLASPQACRCPRRITTEDEGGQTAP